jgi:uncharacterized membrane protein
VTAILSGDSRASSSAPAPSGPGSYRQPRSVEELTEKNVRAIHHLECAAQRHRSWTDVLADRVSRFGGSPTFLWLHVAWFGAWLAFNSLPSFKHFDPFPFTFLTLVVSLEAIFLATFILISQNHASRISDRRNQLDLQINLLTEQENTKMLHLLNGIARKLGVESADEASLQALEQATRPDRLVEQIERAAAEERQR